MQISKELYEKFDKYGKAILNEDGSEILDDRKVESAVHLKRPLSLVEQIKRLMRGPLAAEARQNEMETLEEANDFDSIEDPEDAQNFSGYEIGPDDIPVTMEDVEPPPDPLPDNNNIPPEDLVSGGDAPPEVPPEA